MGCGVGDPPNAKTIKKVFYSTARITLIRNMALSVTVLKGIVARDDFSTLSLHPRYGIRIFKFFLFCRTLASFSVFSILLTRTL